MLGLQLGKDILSVEVQLVLRLTSLCQSHLYSMVSVCMYDTSGWVANPYSARSANCLCGQFVIKDVTVIANLWLCEPSLKIDHENLPHFVGL